MVHHRFGIKYYKKKERKKRNTQINLLLRWISHHIMHNLHQTPALFTVG